MKNILFLVPDSTGIRNYLYSDIIKHLTGNAKIAIWSPLPNKVFDAVREFHAVEIQYRNLQLPQESILGRWLRETATFARLKWNAKKVNNPTILTNWNYKPKGGFTVKLFNKTNRWIGSIFSRHYDLILKLETLSRNLWSKDVVIYYEEMLKCSSVDKVFITHQRAVHLMPICLAAKKLGIEVITVVYSWDNLPKARLNVWADKYLVWSDYMKKEVNSYYPEISHESVVVTGTPQFEFYQKRELITSKEKFAAKFGLNPMKKWVMYSGCDTLTSPYDQEYLEDVTVALMDQEDVQVILRKSPADFSERFDKVIHKFKNKIFALDPIWFKGDKWFSIIPMLEDFEMLANLAFHCDLAINVGSTVAHDFANFNKPTIYVNYEQNNWSSWSVKEVNSFQHFRSMPSQSAVVFVNFPEDWKETILKVIRNPNKFAKDRIDWFHIINQMDDVHASKKIANILLSQCM